MKKITEKNLISGRIDDIGRLLLSHSQMKYLNFVEGEEVSLDFNDEGIIIAKSLGYSLAYDRIKVMPNGVLIGRDICRSKLLMTDDRKAVESTKTNTKNDSDIPSKVYYNVDYQIKNDRIIIPLTKKQQQADIRVIRTIDQLGRIIIPSYLRRIYNLIGETGIDISGNNIILSNSFERKVNINELGMITIPMDLLESIDLAPNLEVEIEAGKNITLLKPSH